MNLIEEIKDYIYYVKENYYIYELQKVAIELFLEYVKKESVYISSNQSIEQIVDYFLAFWIPKRKKYLTESEAFNIVHTMQDLQVYLADKYELVDEFPVILDSYGEDYRRVYKAKELIRQIIGDPVLSTNPYIINLENYKEYKEKLLKKESMCMYEQGMFKIEEVNFEGYVVLNKMNGNKMCKVLFSPNQLHYFKVNDIIHVGLKRKIFFMYWELEELKAYYPKQAQIYL